MAYIQAMADVAKKLDEAVPASAPRPAGSEGSFTTDQILGIVARRVREGGAVEEIPASPRFVEWAHERAAVTGRPVEEMLRDPSLRSFAALVDSATPDELAREGEKLRIRREVYGGDILAEGRALRDGTHPLHPNRRLA